MDIKRRIRLGIWGLGRGMSFYKTCEALGIDVVAGCDYNEHMRKNFLQACPGAFATDDAEKFLAYDMDAVLLATYCTEHAEDAIRVLKAGKHVLSEVTAFHTMAEGVKLVEAVEASGKVYQLAENYPFGKAPMFLAEQYRKGLFGELQYAEFEYVHNCLPLSYSYIDGVPIKPGNTAHFWRSWIHFHYYNTHSLGPIMYITGLRPTRVVSLLGAQGVPGFLDRQYQGIAPSLMTMSNGAVFRNLMGATPNDTHLQRFWGTLGAAEMAGDWLQLKLGGGQGHSSSLKFNVKAEWPVEFADMAAQTGHGGGDFWVLYFFARQIREGIPGPFDVYAAADCTIAGILAYRSAVENGKAYDIPDFRDKAQRAAWRNDHFAQARYDVAKGCFPAGADPAITGTFSKTMTEIIGWANTCRALDGWAGLASKTAPESVQKIREVRDKFLAKLPEIQALYRQARVIVDAYPQSDGARVLKEMLDLGGEDRVAAGSFPDWTAI